jgi:methylene-tetrahydromethanopterin dehydrogenase
VVTKINEEFEGERVRGVEVPTSRDVGDAIQNADIVLSAGAAGTELLTLEVLKKYGRKCRIVADINAIPPLGIEGVDSNADGTEIAPNVYGIGALVIGKLKNKIEAQLIKRAVEEPKGVFDHKTAYEIAKKIVGEKEKQAAQAEMPKYWLPLG